MIAGELVEYVSRKDNSGRIHIRAGGKCGPTISSPTTEETSLVLLFAFGGNNGCCAGVVNSSL